MNEYNLTSLRSSNGIPCAQSCMRAKKLKSSERKYCAPRIINLKGCKEFNKVSIKLPKLVLEKAYCK